MTAFAELWPGLAMAGEWEIVELGQKTEKIGSGATPRGGNETYLPDGPFALIRSQNVLDLNFSYSGLAYINQAAALSNVEIQREDILINITGDSVARVCMVDASILPARVNQHVSIIRANAADFDQRYLLYSLVEPSMKQKLLGIASSGATRNALTKRDLERLKISRPPLSEQQKIADLLGSLDNKIQLNRCIIETLEAMASAIFKSWFVDFDPVHAKAEGRSTGLPDEVTELFPSMFDAEGLPVGWRVASLRDLATLNPESWTKATIPETIEYVDLANTKWGRIEAVQTFPNSEAPSRAQRILRPGDTIVGIVRPGNGSFAYIQKEGLTGSTGFAVLRPISPNRSSLVYLAVTARENIETLAFLADGAAYPAVSPADVIDTRLILPGADIIDAFIDAFNAVTSPLLLAIHDRVEQSEVLVNLRDTLLPKLISGELRIAGAEKKVSAA